MNDIGNFVFSPFPKLLAATYFEMKSTEKPTKQRLAKDYEFDLHSVDGGIMYVDNTIYNIEKGYLYFRRPGQVCNSSAPYACHNMTLCFDENMKFGFPYSRQRPGECEKLISHPLIDILPTKIKVSSFHVYADIFIQIRRIAVAPKSKDNTKRYNALINEFFLRLSADVLRHNRMADDENKNIVHPAVGKLCSMLETNIERNISLDDMAAYTGLAPNYLHRIFTTYMNITPNRYLQQLRLERAANLLAETDEQIDVISEISGFTDAAYFTKCFHNYYGLTPREYRKKIRI